MTEKYRMLRDATTDATAVAGSIVYGCAKYDYGLASDDTRMTGIQHVSVTFNPDGDYPFFTVPEHDLEEIT